VLFIDAHLFKDNALHLFIGGSLHHVLWHKYHRDEDFAKAEAYYHAALTLGPKWPPVLKNLLVLYRDHGDAGKARELEKTILRYWPNAGL
jgi:tetratricopeptide (TPR) repeat protein